MGDPSSLRFVPASSAAVPIDWTLIPEATKKLIEQYVYDWEDLPATIGDLAKLFDETKFFGYFRSDIVKVLMDISEFGLQPAPSNGRERPVGPRFYMTYLEQVWFLLFAPGTNNCIVGYSEDIFKNTNGGVVYDEAFFERMAVEATAIAQAFDVTFEQEVSQGKAEMVGFTKKLGGWTAMTLPAQFEESQFLEAILSLPDSHPAYLALMENLSRSFRFR